MIFEVGEMIYKLHRRENKLAEAIEGLEKKLPESTEAVKRIILEDLMWCRKCLNDTRRDIISYYKEKVVALENELEGYRTENMREA